VLIETSVQNKGGFSSDYVNLGENAHAVQSGQRQFIVEFPKAETRDTAAKKSVNKENTQSKRKSAGKKSDSSTPKQSQSAKKKRAATKSSHFDQTVDLNDMDSDDSDVLSASPLSRKNEAASVLPADYTKQLVDTIKKLVTNWADEERA
jgi:hypothetical protein